MISILVLAITFDSVFGHGRLMEPPARNTAWRFGFNVPVEYNDNELFCGGYTVQHQQNNGSCGVCGDNAANPQPRDHEAGGKYGKGIITQIYHPGQVIDIVADITANHWGYLEIKLCPHNRPTEIVTQDCLDRFPLPVVNGDGSKFVIPRTKTKKVVFKYKVILPFITCTQCVMQWTYYTGNTWGICDDGSERVGCGPQENFVNCADVAIVTSTATRPKPKPKFRLYVQHENFIKPLVVRYDVCKANGVLSDVPGMSHYCKLNCMKYPPYCPAHICSCYSDCYAVGDFAKEKEADVFCNQVCLRYPPDCPDCGPVCPRSRCMCTP